MNDYPISNLTQGSGVSSSAVREWHAYLDSVLGIVENLIPSLPELSDSWQRKELYRSIFSQMMSAYLGLLFADKEFPDFWPFTSPASAYAGANPDHDYYITPVDGAGVYKISGFRGTVKRIDLQIGTGTFFTRGVLDENKLGLTLANYDFDELKIAADGSFDVVISTERPAGHDGNWFYLDPKASYFLMRQTSYDWLQEADGRLAIERLDRPAAKPRATEAQLDDGLRQLGVWAREWVKLSIDFVQGIYRDQGVNRMAYKDLREYGELLTQKYAYGGFLLAPDEALVVEAKVPDVCRYWSIHLMGDLGFTLDWVNRHTHLNGHMAWVDADGVFRAVVSSQDPGVPNWLDTMGYPKGAIQARWEGCNRFPEHKVTKVKLAQVRDHLPVATPHVNPDERDATIRSRRRGVQMRKRW